METQTPIQATKPIAAPKPIDLGHNKLLEALFFFWDGFERASMNFFLVKDTAKQIIKNDRLTGDKVTIGIRRLEWNGGQQHIFRAFMEHEKVLPKGNKDLLVFKYKEVPVYLYIYEDNPSLTSFDVVFYAQETFNIPNPFNTFEEQYDK